MATLIVNMRTDYRRGEIHHIDISLIHRNDSRLNRYTILPRVPDTAPGMDLTDVLRIAEFDNLSDLAPYIYVFRLFLNIEPDIALRSESFTTEPPNCRGFFLWRTCSPAIMIANVLIERNA